MRTIWRARQAYFNNIKVKITVSVSVDQNTECLFDRVGGSYFSCFFPLPIPHFPFSVIAGRKASAFNVFNYIVLVAQVRLDMALIQFLLCTASVYLLHFYFFNVCRKRKYIENHAMKYRIKLRCTWKHPIILKCTKLHKKQFF